MPANKTISSTFTATSVVDGLTYQIELSVGSVTISSDQTQATLTTVAKFYAKEGDAARVQTPFYTCAFLKKDSAYTRITDTSKYPSYSGKVSQATLNALTVTKSNADAVVICIYDVATQTHTNFVAEIEIPVYKQGDTGARGKQSRFPRFWGAWEDFADGVKNVTITDTQTWYFQRTDSGQKRYWLWTGNNGTYTSAQMGTPSSSSGNWEIMTDDFRYLITKVMFADFAQLGAAIFLQEMMFSQYGYKDGVRSDDYGDMGISGSEPATFFPNIWMNWMAGILGITEGALQVMSKTGKKLAQFGVSGGYGSLKFFDTDGTTELIEYGVEGIGYILANSTMGGFTEHSFLSPTQGGAVNSFFNSNHGMGPAPTIVYRFSSTKIKLKNGTTKDFNSGFDGKYYTSKGVNAQGNPTGSTWNGVSMDSMPISSNGSSMIYRVRNVSNGVLTGNSCTITIERTDVLDMQTGQVTGSSYKQVALNGNAVANESVFTFSF